jgi:hypothetical protein
VRLPFVQNLNNQKYQETLEMPVTHEQITELRAQLQRDRELIGKDEAAQPFLDFQERNIEALENKWAERDPVAALDHVLSEIENNEIGRDSATAEDLAAITLDIRENERTLEAVPVENRNTPLFKIAEQCIALQKKNCIALADKTDLQDRIFGVVESTKRLRAELEEVDRLIRANAELNLGATHAVFEHFRDSLMPALDSVLGKSLGDILSAS